MPNFNMTKGVSTDPKIDNPEELGLTIKEIRLRRGLTQEQLAIRVSASASSIKNLEKGKVIYEPPYLSKLLKFLGLSEKE